MDYTEEEPKQDFNFSNSPMYDGIEEAKYKEKYPERSPYDSHSGSNDNFNLSTTGDHYSSNERSLMYSESSIVVNTNEEMEKVMENIDGVWSCRMCGKMAKKKGNMKFHIEGKSFW